MLVSAIRTSGHAFGLQIVRPLLEQSMRARLREPPLRAACATARQRLGSDTRAVTALEYGLIGAAIAAVIAGTVFSLGTTTNSMFSAVATAL